MKRLEGGYTPIDGMGVCGVINVYGNGSFVYIETPSLGFVLFCAVRSMVGCLVFLDLYIPSLSLRWSWSLI